MSSERYMANYNYLLSSYINGNYVTSLYLDGSKVYRGLRVDEELDSKFPDSIDLKITNRCSIGCPYCHESSVKDGKSFDLKKTISVLDTLPKVGIEVAIGGGDVLDPSVKPDLEKLIEWLYENNFNPRITINIETISSILNQKNSTGISKYFFVRNPINKKLEKDLGISSVNIKLPVGISINKFGEREKKIIHRIAGGCSGYYIPVYHIIAGIFPPESIDELVQYANILNGAKILVLGYKSFGRGKTITPKYNLLDVGKTIKSTLLKFRGQVIPKSKGSVTIAFDNLAIEQLNLREAFTTSEWESIYMGDEFTHTMYIDAVEETFAPTSRNENRSSWQDYQYNVVEYFINNKKK